MRIPMLLIAMLTLSACQLQVPRAAKQPLYEGTMRDLQPSLKHKCQSMKDGHCDQLVLSPG